MNNIITNEVSPPENGPQQSSTQNWINSIYLRFDHSFVTFYMIEKFYHGL